MGVNIIDLTRNQRVLCLPSSLNKLLYQQDTIKRGNYYNLMVCIRTTIYPFTLTSYHKLFIIGITNRLIAIDTTIIRKNICINPIGSRSDSENSHS